MAELDPRKAALESDAEARLITGKAGCGKTYFGCELAINELKLASKVAPHQRVLFLTFARNAVARILETINQHLDSEVDRRRLQDRLVANTFCGFFWWLVENYGMYRPSCKAERIWLAGTHRVNEIPSPEGYRAYTFDEIERAAVDTISVPYVLELISQLWPLVIIDEFQDVNPLQYEVVRRLGGVCKLVLLYGPGQSLYAFRNADSSRTLASCRSDLSPCEFDIPPLGGDKTRFTSPIQTVVDAFKTRSIPASSSRWPLKYAPVSRPQKHPNRPAPVHMIAAKTAVEMRKHLRSTGARHPHVAVLTYTNAAAIDIQQKITRGSDAYFFKGRACSVRANDELNMCYGRLMLELLQCHWISEQTRLDTPGHALFQTAALAALNKDRRSVETDWSVLVEKLCTKLRRQKEPKAGHSAVQTIQRNLLDLNSLLQMTKAEAKKNGFPADYQSPVRSKEEGILDLATRSFIGTIAPLITNNRINLAAANIRFEQAMRESIVYEKIGITKDIEVMTIQKAKGREFDGVVLVLDDRPDAPWRAGVSESEDSSVEDSCYVAVSRARSAFALVANSDAANLAKPVVKYLLPTDRFARSSVE